MQKNTFEKISLVRELLIEQIFELREPGPPGRTCTPTTGCFHDKTIISKGKYSTGLLFTSKISQEAMYSTFPYLGQITHKM